MWARQLYVAPAKEHEIEKKRRSLETSRVGSQSAGRRHLQRKAIWCGSGLGPTSARKGRHGARGDEEDVGGPIQNYSTDIYL